MSTAVESVPLVGRGAELRLLGRLVEGVRDTGGAVVGQVEELPGPQRDVVSAAFGGAEAVAPDLFLIALGTLNLMAEAAARVPVLLVVRWRGVARVESWTAGWA